MSDVFDIKEEDREFVGDCVYRAIKAEEALFEMARIIKESKGALWSVLEKKYGLDFKKHKYVFRPDTMQIIRK